MLSDGGTVTRCAATDGLNVYPNDLTFIDSATRPLELRQVALKKPIPDFSD